MRDSVDKNPRIKVSRKKKKDPNASVAEDHAQKTGEIIGQWNSLHSVLMAFFCEFVERDDVDPGRSIWHTLKSDLSQRDILSSLAEVRLKKRTGLKKGLKWLIKSVGKLAAYRNAYAHAPVHYSIEPDGSTKIVPSSLAASPGHFDVLTKLSDKKVYRDLMGDLIALEGYGGALWFATFIPERYSSPKRPPLRLLPAQKRGGAQKHQRRHRAKPARQPKSSA